MKKLSSKQDLRVTSQSYPNKDKRKSNKLDLTGTLHTDDLMTRVEKVSVKSYITRE